MENSFMRNIKREAANDGDFDMTNGSNGTVLNVDEDDFHKFFSNNNANTSTASMQSNRIRMKKQRKSTQKVPIFKGKQN
jgi:hypothetical protein